MLRIQIIDPRTTQKRELEHETGPLEFGRGPRQGSTPRCTVDGDYISRNHMRIEQLPTGWLRILNLSGTNPVKLPDSTVAPGGTLDIRLPVRLGLGPVTINIDGGPADDIDSRSLKTIASPSALKGLASAGASLQKAGDAPGPETLAYWFEQVIAVQRAAAGSQEFYQQTARALVDVVGLDRGLVLLRRNTSWEPVARVCAQDDHCRVDFSQTILRRVLEERCTFYQSAATPVGADSLMEVEAVVASPIHDAQNQIVGVVYGSRNRASGAAGTGIGSLEALVVQLLASAAGAGLARQAQELEASHLRSQFEQFFSPKLARELQRNPKLLEGQEREVTVLFSDLRGFSRLAERLGPSNTCRLVRDAMDRFTSRIREYDGVVVDFAGDGMMAMWNAPADQPDHAGLACRAALAMLADLPEISESYRDLLGSGLGLGIGINTGQALVGNVGSRTRLKYGPFGHAVNLASRVEGATKQLGVPLLVTGSTRSRLGDLFALRRLCRVRVVGMEGVVDLFELHGESASDDWTTRRGTYEKALGQFEAGDWAAACQTIHPLLSSQAGQYDLPSLDLVSRAVECLRSPPERFDSAVELKLK